MTPRSRKSGDGLLLGCRSGLDRETFKSIFCDDFERTQKINDGNIFTVCSGSLYRNRSGVVRGRISREGALEVRESRERRDKILAEIKKRPKFRIRNSSFQWGTFIFFAAENPPFFFGGGVSEIMVSR